MNALGTRIEASLRNGRPTGVSARIEVIFVARAPFAVEIKKTMSLISLNDANPFGIPPSPSNTAGLAATLKTPRVPDPADFIQWAPSPKDPGFFAAGGGCGSAGFEPGTERLCSQPELKLVEFSLAMPAAKTVQLAADFTEWEQSPIDMIRFDDGVWSTTVPLPAGTYAYRFLVDGQWYDDPRTARRGPNSARGPKALIQIK